MTFSKQFYSDRNDAGRLAILTSRQSDWETDSVNVEAADNSGNRVVAVSTLFTTARRHQVSFGTSLIIRCRYAVGAVTTSPVIQVVGVDKNGLFNFLLNGASTPTDEITVTCVQATDLTDGTYNYSAISSSTVLDLMGCTDFFFVVKVAASLPGTSTARLQYKVV